MVSETKHRSIRPRVWMSGGTDRSTNARMDVCTDGQKHEWTDRRMDGQ